MISGKTAVVCGYGDVKKGFGTGIEMGGTQKSR
ncbi:MAG: hypothetical protein CM15mP6_0040 [Methanobacteriota archaeon]|nr:MAG: hypothetical protein CM15mP6_0040 [Euryarchaeota archaeon]